jgi:hypothetical protein
MAERAAIPAYDGSVFISYARADDLEPPYGAKVGWVRFFWDNLQYELAEAGIGRAQLWVDRNEIEPSEKFPEKIAEGLAKARLLLPVLSLNWVQSEWCWKELDTFIRLHTDDPEDNIVLVKKHEVPENDIPEPLRNREGYKFFEKEPTGGVRQFYWRGVYNETAYNDQVKLVAQSIAKRFISERTREKRAVPRKGRSVYLAAPADEMRDPWRRLANDLEGAGYDVLPVDGRLPDTAAKAEEAIRTALNNASMVVHLLGEIEGVTLAGGTENLTKLQLRIAREHGIKSPIPRVLWAPKLPPDLNEKRDPFAVVARFGGISRGEEIYAEDVTQLSQMLRYRLDPPMLVQKPVQDIPRLIVLSAAPEDDGDANQLANRLNAPPDVRARPTRAGDPLPASAQPGDIALIPWGAAGVAAIDKLMTDLIPVGLRVYVLRLPGGDLSAKRAFFVDEAIVEDLEALPPDRRSARELLERLDIVAAVTRPNR